MLRFTWNILAIAAMEVVGLIIILLGAGISFVIVQACKGDIRIIPNFLIDDTLTLYTILFIAILVAACVVVVGICISLVALLGFFDLCKTYRKHLEAVAP